jgi:acyl carrier protein
MDAHQTLLSLINRIRKVSNKPHLDDISSDQILQNDLQLDSLDLAELTVNLEAKYGVDIFESSSVSTVKDVLNKLP